MLYCLSDCHFKNSLGLFTWLIAPGPVNEYFFLAAPAGNSWLPVRPQLPRNLSRFMKSTLKNSSRLTFHANAKEGKYPYLLFSPNLVEPSALNVPVTRYLSL